VPEVLQAVVPWNANAGWIPPGQVWWLEMARTEICVRYPHRISSFCPMSAPWPHLYFPCPRPHCTATSHTSWLLPPTEITFCVRSPEALYMLPIKSFFSANSGVTVEYKFGSVYFASWAKITAGVILPLAKLDWLKWSHDKFEAYDLLRWPWRL